MNEQMIGFDIIIRSSYGSHKSNIGAFVTLEHWRHLRDPFT